MKHGDPNRPHLKVLNIQLIERTLMYCWILILTIIPSFLCIAIIYIDDANNVIHSVMNMPLPNRSHLDFELADSNCKYSFEVDTFIISSINFIVFVVSIDFNRLGVFSTNLMCLPQAYSLVVIVVSLVIYCHSFTIYRLVQLSYFIINSFPYIF